MGQVTLSIGGNSHLISCRDGEEAQLLRLGAIVDEKVKQGIASAGSGSEARQLLFGALLLADALTETGKVSVVETPAEPSPSREQLEAVARRIEALAEKLERSANIA